MIDAETNATAATVAAQGATAAPDKNASKKAASRKKGAPKGKKTAKGAKPGKQIKTGKKSARQTKPRTEGKGAKIVGMIGRTKGATLAEIMAVTGWQAHSVRGFISTAGKKHNVKIESVKNDSGDRIYRITK
jgi:hypothetical protein